MNKQALSALLASSEEFFERSTRCLTEAESGFAPAAGMFTAAQQVAHAAQTIEWFLQGADTTFDLDFPKHEREVRAVQSLAAAREQMARAYAAARRFIETRSEEELM